MSGSNTPNQIPIEVTTGSSAQQVDALANRVKALQTELGKLVPVFNTLGEDGPKALRAILSQMSALNRLASSGGIMNVMVGQLGASASNASRTRRAATEFGVQQAAGTSRFVPDAIRSGDANALRTATEIVRRQLDVLRIAQAEAQQKLSNNSANGISVSSVQKNLDQLSVKISEAVEKLNRLGDATSRVTEAQRIQAGVQSRIRSLRIADAFERTPEGQRARQQREQDALTRGVQSRVRSVAINDLFAQTEVGQEQAALKEQARLRRVAEREERRARREAERQERLDRQQAEREERTNNRIRVGTALRRRREELAEQQKQEREANALPSAIRRGTTAAQAQSAIFADQSIRGLLLQNQAERTRLGLEAFNALARTPQFAQLLTERAFTSGIANQQARLQLTGNAQFQQNAVTLGLRNAETRLSIREAEAANPGLQSRDRSLNNARSLDRLFGDGGGTLLTIQAGLLANYTVLNQLFSAFTNTARAVVDFDNALKNLQAISASTNGEMEKLGRIIVDTSFQTKFSAVEITEAATQLAQAGLSVREIGQALQGTTLLATATGSDLRTAVDITTTALSVFRQRADEVPRLADQMTAALNLSKLTIDQVALGFQYVGNAAADAGLSLTETTAALATLANQGIRSGSTIGTGFRQLLVDLQSPNERLAARFRELNITMADVDVRANGFVGVLQNLRRAGFTSADAFETIELRAAAAFSAFVRGANDLTELQDSLNRTGGAAQANATQMESLSNRFLQLQNAINGVAYTMSRDFIAVLGRIVGGVSGGIAEFGKMTETLRVLGGVITGLAIGGLIALLGRLTLSAAAAASGIFGLTGAVTALGAAVRFVPFVAFFSALASGALVLSEIIFGANRAGRELETLRQQANETGDTVRSTNDALRGLNEFIENLTRRTRTLESDQGALSSTILEAQGRFAGLSNAVNVNITSYSQLIGVLRQVRGELALTLAAQTQAQAIAATNLADAAETRLAESTGVGPAQTALVSGLNLSGRQARDVQSAVTGAAQRTIAEAQRRGGDATSGDVEQAGSRALVETLSRILNAPEGGTVRRALELLSQRGGGNATDIQTLINDLTEVSSVRGLPAGVNAEQAATLRTLLGQRLTLVQGAQSARADATRLQGQANAAREVSGVNFQQAFTALDVVQQELARRQGSISEGRNLTSRRNELAELERVLAPYLDSLNQLEESAQDGDARRALDQSGISNALATARGQLQALRRSVGIAASNAVVSASEAASERLRTQIEEWSRNPSRDPQVLEERRRLIRDGAEERRTQRLRGFIETLSRPQRNGAVPTDQERASLIEAETERLNRERNTFVRDAERNLTQGVVNELESRLNTLREQLRTGLALTPGSRTQTQGTDEQNRALLDQINSTIAEIGSARGDSVQVIANAQERELLRFNRSMSRVAGSVRSGTLDVALRVAEETQAEALAVIRRIQGENTRDPNVARTQKQQIEEAARRGRDAAIEELNSRVERLRGSGASTSEIQRFTTDGLSRINQQYETIIQTIDDRIIRGVIRETEARLRAVTQQLRTGLSRVPGSRGQSRGSAESNQALMDEAMRLIETLGRDRRDSAETISQNQRAFREQFSRVGVNGGSAPEAAFIPNARTTIQQSLRNAQSELDTRLRASRTGIDARRAQLDAARRLPNMFPQSYTNQLDREINDMEMAFERNAIKAREGYLAALDGIFERATKALDDLKKLLEGASGAEAQRIGQRIDEAQSTLDSVTQARERARVDVSRSRALISARNPETKLGVLDGFTAAGNDFRQRMGLDDSAFKITADSLTTLFNSMQSASANFFETLVTGSASASDAFRAFGVSILKTVAQIATQRLAAELIGLAISTVGGFLGGGASGGGAKLPTSKPVALGYEGGLVTSRGIMRFAGGGMVPGTNVGRDTVPALLAPGEAVLNRRAVSLVGTDSVMKLNAGTVQADQAIQPLAIRREPDNVSVYVMAPNEKPSLGPKDVLAVIGQDVLTGGATKQLIRQVAVGAL